MLAIALLIGNLALAGADLATTCYGLGAGTVREVNPILRPLSQHPAALGAVKLAVTSGAVLALYQGRHAHPRLTRWALVGMVVGQAAVVWWNVRQLRR